MFRKGGSGVARLLQVEKGGASRPPALLSSGSLRESDDGKAKALLLVRVHVSISFFLNAARMPGRLWLCFALDGAARRGVQAWIQNGRLE